jgi:hypothetical protein
MMEVQSTQAACVDACPGLHLRYRYSLRRRSFKRSSPRSTTITDYSHFLGRTPDQAGLNYWVSQFTAGLTNENLIAGFIASDEYFNKAILG